MPENILEEFEPIFYPRSIAVIGVSGKGGMANKFFNSLLDGGFKGKVYGVNSRGGELRGMPLYTNLNAIPEPVDYVISSAPKQAVSQIIDDCGTKGVKVVHLFAAGFSEAGEEGLREEDELAAKAKQLNVRVIGPNCIGISCPEHGTSLEPTPLPDSRLMIGDVGSVAFISQSGGNGVTFIEAGLTRGIGMSKVISFGNGCDLKASDFMEYLAVDPKTEVIAGYLEGARDARRLFEVLTQVCRKKPVVIWKGGTTESGAKMTSSHTGSLAGSDVAWEVAFRQAGVVRADGLDEMADAVLAFQSFGRLDGNRVFGITGLPGGGGGFGVALADACMSQGLSLPAPSEETKARLKPILPPAGCILRNPVDMSAVAYTPENASKAIEVIFNEPGIDAILLHLPVSMLIGIWERDGFNAMVDKFIDLRRSYNKPLVICSPPCMYDVERVAMEKKLAQARIPCYPTLHRAAGAIQHVARYSEFRREVELL